MVTRYLFVLTATACLSASALAAEEKSPDFGATTLTGDWGGTRTRLYNKGIDLGFTHKSDFLSNTSGGLKRGTAWMGHTEARIKMDMEKLAGWDATSAYVHFHSDSGSKFNRDYVGSFVGADNIETGVNTAQFYHAWIQKSFSDESLSVLAGLYPIDSEFYVTDTSGVFIQPPYGMANDLAQPVTSGASQAPAIFPTGALAVRVKYTSPNKNFYAQYAISDGIPGDPNNQYGTHIQLNRGDGTLSIAEFGYTPQQDEPPFEAAKPGDMVEPKLKVHEEHESFNKTAIGLWRYSAQFDDPAGSARRYPSEGVYLLLERTLHTEQDHPAQGLSGFVRLGTANSALHQADWTGSAGLRYHGLLEGRDDDIAGIAITYNHAGDQYRLANNAKNNQTQVEATYRAQINSWFALQPTLQFIANPNMDPALQNTWIAGVRAEIAF